MTNGQPVPSGRSLLRLVSPKSLHTGEDPRPTSAALEPSTDDKKRTPVRVSVWDMTLTTLDEALAITNKPTYIAYSIGVDDLAALSDELAWPALRAVYESLEPPASMMPGADGHGGVEGLERGGSKDKKEWRERLDAVVRRLRSA